MTAAPAPVAQLDRASVYGTEGHRFESCRARCRPGSPFGARVGSYGGDQRATRIVPASRSSWRAPRGPWPRPRRSASGLRASGRSRRASRTVTVFPLRVSRVASRSSCSAPLASIRSPRGRMVTLPAGRAPCVSRSQSCAACATSWGAAQPQPDGLAGRGAHGRRQAQHADASGLARGEPVETVEIGAVVAVRWRCRARREAVAGERVDEVVGSRCRPEGRGRGARAECRPPGRRRRLRPEPIARAAGLVVVGDVEDHAWRSRDLPRRNTSRPPDGPRR